MTRALLLRRLLALFVGRVAGRLAVALELAPFLLVLADHQRRALAANDVHH